MECGKSGQIIIPAGVSVWPHELRVARILADAGHRVEFMPTGVTKTADILLDGVAYEIKSPLTNRANTLEHMLKRALRQSSNLIIDSSRVNGKRFPDTKLCSFLINKMRQQRQIKRLLFVTRNGQIIDISLLV